MTLEANFSKQIFTGNGSVTSFSCSIMFFSAADILITRVSTAGVETVISEGTGAGDYAKTFVDAEEVYPAQFDFTFPATGTNPMASGEKLVVQRVVDYLQSLDLGHGATYNPSVLETALDKLVAMVQQIDEKQDRAVLASVSETSPLVLPTAADRASKFFAFDASGLPIASSGGISGAITVSAFMQTVVDDANAAAARATLDAQQGLLALLTVNGDILIRNTSGALARLGIGSSGSLLRVSSGAPAWLAPGSAGQVLTISSGVPAWVDAPLPRSYLAGFKIANNGVDAVNDLDFAAGSCRDDTNTDNMIGAALTKRADATWAVGNNQGMLDTGVVGNNTYHLFVIKRTDTGVVDYLMSLSPTAPTMPTNYTLKRRIGSLIRSAGQWIRFIQRGDRFDLDAAVTDVSAVNPGTSAVTRTLSVPTGVVVDALVLAGAHVVGGTVAVAVLLTPLDIADTAPTVSISNFHGGNAAASNTFHGSMTQPIRTNTSAQIRSRLSNSTANVTLVVTTHGWVDTRGRDD